MIKISGHVYLSLKVISNLLHINEHTFFVMLFFVVLLSLFFFAFVLFFHQSAHFFC